MIWRLVGTAGTLFLLSAGAAFAQTSGLENLLPQGGSTSTRIIQVIVVITLLSVAPGLLMMVTCFTRFVVVFSFLRAGLGMQTTPSNIILISLALFMTLFVMAPTFDQAWQNGAKPLMEEKIGNEEAFVRITTPFKNFMRANVREKDLAMFETIASERFANTDVVAKDDLRVLVPAFMISELRRGFEIGFLIVLPFLVIDMIVATVVMSMGMMMLPPTVFSLPLKVLFFVLIDGWSLLVAGLIKSYG
jgi:flagellar biosynthetic protein FliP